MSTGIKITRYGDAHSNFYQKSVLADLLVTNTLDSEGKCEHTTICNDVALLLRQKNIHNQIGLDALRSYVESLQRDTPEPHNFTDDELFQLIEPKSINTLTDAYQYAKYIQSHSDDIKSRYKQISTEKAKYQKMISYHYKHK